MACYARCQLRSWESRSFVVEVRAEAEVITFPSARNYGKTKNMKKSIKVEPKRRGRPSTGRDPVMGLRMSPNLKGAVVKWAENQPDKPTLSEATRRLVEIGLTVKSRPKQTSTAHARKADTMAAGQLDQLADRSASVDQRASRKSDLLIGPEEFRHVRIDRAKPK